MSKYSAEVYWEFSDSVYEDDNLKKENILPIKDEEFVVLNSIDDSKTGLQAIAVVSKSDWDKMQVNSSFQPDITFVSRGTKDGTDWLANVKDLSIGPRYDALEKLEKQGDVGKKQAESIRNNNQFYLYEKFVEETLSSPKYGRGTTNYDFTGHSLGGALAQFMAVLTGKEATTYASALPYALLPKSLQKRIDKGEFDHLITDYRHQDDVVPYLPLVFKRVGKSYYIQTGIRGMIAAHLKASFSSYFNSDGSVRIYYDVKSLKDHANNFSSFSSEILDISKGIQKYEEQEGMVIYNLLRSIRNNQSGGAYSELSDSDVEDVLRTTAPYFENGVPRCYNKAIADEMKSKLTKTSTQIGQLGRALSESAHNAEQEDSTQANSFKLNMKGFR